MKYEIVIEETVSQKFTVEANSSEEAVECAIASYKAGKLVLEEPDVNCRQVAVVAPDCEVTEWEEF